ncbi:MAG: hypothetical protein PHH21_03085 [Candidatus Pacebacteria bacterium]|nr:hypothetical protein [Candidatus Paceibacterota bacterium]
MENKECLCRKSDCDCYREKITNLIFGIIIGFIIGVVFAALFIGGYL